jgi:hypothetical protein
MKKILNLFNLVSIGLFLLLGIMVSCGEDEEVLFDNSLKVLAQTINGAPAVNGLDGVSKNAVIEIIFSHTLSSSAFESALSISGLSSSDYTIAYSNTNSTVAITPNAPLDFSTTYTMILPPGSYGAGGEELRENFSLSFTVAPFIPPNVTISVSTLSISEDGGTTELMLTLSEAVDEVVSVTLDVSGEATQGSDYEISTTNVTLAEGEMSQTVVITAIQDGDIEGTESIEISIGNIINAVILEAQSVSINILDDDIDSNGDGVPDQGFIINEVLFDPPGGDAGDANGDGTRSASADEFIEFVNDSDTEVDLSGYTLYDATNLETLEPRHTFPDGTIIPPGGVYVLFGGGNPSGDFGSAQVGASTSGNMNLNNADDAITVLDRDGNVFITFDTQVEGSGINFGADQSVTRMPDVYGDFTLHTTANPDLLYSPGKKSDGSNFAGGMVDTGVGFVINEVLFDPPGGDAGDANGDGTRSASADEFIEFVNDSNNPVDLSGFTLYDATNLETLEPRHIFSDGTVIPPGGVYILFGGGTPSGSFGGAQVGVSTTGNMNLNNADDAITILDTNGNVFITFDTQVEGMGIDFGADQSVTRSPDLEGMFTLHTTANAALLFSPGTKADGSSF